MKKLKAIVVEDERLPRLSLLAKLEDFRHSVEVVDSCENYDSALMSILQHRPDLLFLDIQLQGRDKSTECGNHTSGITRIYPKKNGGSVRVRRFKSKC